MKGFSLIETAFALVILGILFSFFYSNYAQYTKNFEFFSLNQRLFNEEKAVQNANSSEISLDIENLGLINFVQKSDKNSIFKLKSLSPANSDFEDFFR